MQVANTMPDTTTAFHCHPVPDLFVGAPGRPGEQMSTPAPVRRAGALASRGFIGHSDSVHIRSDSMTRTRAELPGARWTQRVFNRSARRAAKRDALLELLPKGSVGAEVGVFAGDFSDRILAIVRPRKLHLIDPWTYMASELPKDGLSVSADYADPSRFEQRWEQVRSRFHAEIASGQVELHRALSTDAARGFSEPYFDWVYLDANHHYDFVLRDLAAYLPLIKPGGFLTGDDFGRRGRWDNGVERAVREFLVRNPTLEPLWLGRAHQFLLERRRA
jgi:hypothetical protein